MKHPSVRAYYSVWNERRGDAAAPDRFALEPDAVRELLGDIFVLGCQRASGYPYRVAGTRICALLGHDAKGHPFIDAFAADSRREIADLIDIVAEETEPAVAGLSARSADGRTVALELLLLPFAPRPHAPLSLTGLLAPLDPVGTPLTDFHLLTWRYVARRPTDRPRGIRRWAAARGFFVYEGLR